MKTRPSRLCATVLAVAILCAVATTGHAASPDLVGYDGRSNSSSTIKQYFFAIQETQVHWGQSFHFKFAVANVGSAAAGAFNVKFYLTTGGTATPGNGSTTCYLNASTRFTSGLAVNSLNGSIDYSAYITLPTINPFTTSQTTYYLNMVVDSDNEIAESNESNNSNQGSGKDTASLTILPPVPNLVVTDSVAPFTDLSVPFGNVAADGSGGAVGKQTVTLANSGTKALTFSSISLAAGTLFKIASIQSSTQTLGQPVTYPRALASGSAESWIVNIQFDPLTAGSATDTLVLKSDDPTRPTVNVALSGIGVAVPSLTVIDPDSAPTDRSTSFGGVINDGAGGASGTLTVTLRNDGTGPLTISQNGLTMMTGTHFKLVSVTSNTRGAINLASAASTIAASGAETWAVVLKFDPTATGPLTDALNIASNDPNFPAATVSLAGIGLVPMTLVVTDSQGSATDHAIDFGRVHADGAGKQTGTATLTLVNTGGADLAIAQNGFSLANGTDFKVAGVQSSTRGTIDLSTAAQTISANSAETWTVSLVFDPLSGGAKSTTLTIASNDPAHLAVTVALTGTGLTQPGLAVTDSIAPPNDHALDFGTVLNDGAGNRVGQQTVTITDIGAVGLVINQNGITLPTGGPAFAVQSVVSSTRGTVNLASANAADRTIAPAQAETWMVTLAFDPTANASYTGGLQIAGNDPDTPQVAVSLAGKGAQPSITVTSP